MARLRRCSQFSAAKCWAELVANYSIACRSPRPPTAVVLDAVGGTRLIPTPPLASRKWLAMSAPARLFSKAVRRASQVAKASAWSVCVRDQALAGFSEFEAFRRGLTALSTLWSAKRKAGPRER